MVINEEENEATLGNIEDNYEKYRIIEHSYTYNQRQNLSVSIY